MLDALTYCINSFRYPHFRDFIDMGYGINARYKRSKKFWDKHLFLCKKFQEQSLSGYNAGGRAAVLGAGSLLDINLQLLKQKFSSLELFDANTSLKYHWSRSFKKSHLEVKFNFMDLTASLETWCIKLKKMLEFDLSRTEDLITFLSELEPEKSQIFKNYYEVIFSINLLSQIPVYWRDRVHNLVKKFAGLDTDSHGLYPGALQDALELSMRKLQLQHLKLLSESGAEYLILITDREFLYYNSNKSEWQPERALYSDLSIGGYNEEYSDSWFWHIAPQGIEYNSYGCIHDVIAKAFKIQDLKNNA